MVLEKTQKYWLSCVEAEKFLSQSLKKLRKIKLKRTDEKNFHNKILFLEVLWGQYIFTPKNKVQKLM